MTPGAQEDPYKTRASLLSAIKADPDNPRWWEFDRLYRGFILSIALKMNLPREEAQDVVQEVEIKVLKYLGSFDAARAPFRTWLRTMTKRVVIDHIRKRMPVKGATTTRQSGQTRRTATIERQPDSAVDFDDLWRVQWMDYLTKLAKERVKQQVSLRDWQVFDAYVNKEIEVEKVANLCGVKLDQVYLIKHRVVAQLKQETRRLQDEAI